MAELVFPYLPNKFTQKIAGADNTTWHQVTLPSAVPTGQLVNVIVSLATVATAGNAAGALIFVDFNFPTGTPPTIGFPVFTGTVLTVDMSHTLWYKFSTATDTLYLLWQW